MAERIWCRGQSRRESMGIWEAKAVTDILESHSKIV
jgi:hypothetical protein